MAPDEGRLATVAGAVLTGAAPHPAAVRIAGLLAELFEDVVLVGEGAFEGAPGRRAPPVPGPACPLRDLVTALESCAAEQVLVVAGELSRVTPELLLGLVAWPRADAVVPRSAAGPHALCALYDRARVQPVARSHLETGRLALDALLAAVPTATVAGADLARLDPEGLALRADGSPDPAACPSAGGF